MGLAGLGWAGLGRVGPVAVGADWRGLELVSSHTFNEHSKMQFEAKFIQLLFILFLSV